MVKRILLTLMNGRFYSHGWRARIENYRTLVDKNRGRAGFGNDASPSCKHRLQFTDRNVYDVLGLQLERFDFSLHHAAIGNWDVLKLTIWSVTNDAQTLDLCLEGSPQGKRKRLCDIEIASLLHDIAARAVDRTEHVDDTGPAHRYRRSGLNHYIPDRVSTAVSVIVVRLIVDAVLGRGLHFNGFPGKVGLASSQPEDLLKIVRSKHLDPTGVLHFAQHRNAGCGILLDVQRYLGIGQDLCLAELVLQELLRFQHGLPLHMHGADKWHADIAFIVDADVG